MIKKLISSFICATLIFNIGALAYAETIPTVKSIDERFIKSKVSQNFSEMELEKSIDDINLISEKAIPADYLSEAIVEDGQHVYIYQLTEGMESEIRVDEIENGINLNIVEGEKENELILYDDGDIFLNGKEVIFEGVTKNNMNEIIQPKGFTHYTTQNVPYGSSYEYNYFAGDWANGNVELGTTLKAIAVATLATIVSAKIAAILGVDIGVLGKVMFAVAGTIIKNPSDPLSESVSYKYDAYYYEDVETFRINSYLSAEKIVADLYDQAYFEGNYESTTFYSCVDHT